MRAIKFLQRCDFDYGDGPVAHEPGDIVGIHEVGRSSTGLPYYTMPYLPNGDLGRRRRAARAG